MKYFIHRNTVINFTRQNTINTKKNTINFS